MYGSVWGAPQTGAPLADWWVWAPWPRTGSGLRTHRRLSVRFDCLTRTALGSRDLDDRKEVVVSLRSIFRRQRPAAVVEEPPPPPAAEPEEKPQPLEPGSVELPGPVE